MVFQKEIVQLLKRYRPNRLSTKDIKKKLKIKGSITNQLKQLRKFRVIKFKKEKLKRYKTRRTGFVYWV